MSHPLSIEERYQIPSCYMVTAPPMSSKLTFFAEDTLFYVFYTQPQDVAQLEVAEELCVALPSISTGQLLMLAQVQSRMEISHAHTNVDVVTSAGQL